MASTRHGGPHGGAGQGQMVWDRLFSNTSKLVRFAGWRQARALLKQSLGFVKAEGAMDGRSACETKAMALIVE